MESITEHDLVFEEVIYKTELVEVLKAKLKSTKEPVAVKKLITKSIEDENIYNREMRIIDRLEHRNIVGIRGYLKGKRDKEEYVLFVMNFYRKGNLQNEIDRRKNLNQRWPEKELLHHMKSLIEVFSYLQKENFVHRDIKPQSILIGDNDELLVPSLGRIIKNSDNSDEKTIVGTPLYLSPILREALKDQANKRVIHDVFKSDVYSLGLTFYYMACLNDVFEFVSLDQLQARLNSRINAITNYYSERITNILRDMLVVDESARLDFINLHKTHFNAANNSNMQLQAKLKRQIQYKARNLMLYWKNQTITYRVKLKKERSKNILEKLFIDFYMGTDWSRFGEYLYTLFSSKIQIKVYKLIPHCCYCGNPTGDDGIKFHDFFAHSNCLQIQNIQHVEITSDLERINQYGFESSYGSGSSNQPCCTACNQNLSSLSQNPMCNHAICDKCALEIKPFSFGAEESVLCPWCPCIWEPKSIRSAIK